MITKWKQIRGKYEKKNRYAELEEKIKKIKYEKVWNKVE